MSSDNKLIETKTVKKKKKKKKKRKCQYIDIKENKVCGKKLQMFFDMECKYCHKFFCMKHRLFEAHNCSNFNDWKTEKKNILKKTLIDGKATFQKIIKI